MSGGVTKPAVHIKIFQILMVVAVVLIFPMNLDVALAQSKEQEAAGNRIERLIKEKGREENSKLVPELLSGEFLDEKTKIALQRSLTAYYDYRTSGFKHRREVFSWQLFSSKAIFVIVILLVMVGLYFSWLQFRASMYGNMAGVDVSMQTTMEASPKGLRLSSPVLGVIILALSLAFFYLYLAYVYPIKEIL